MKLKLDTVQQAQLRKGAESGFVVRTALITMEAGDLPLAIPDPYTLAKALKKNGLPQIGDKYNDDENATIGDYTRWVVRDYDIRPTGLGPQTLLILIIYRWLGPLQIEDSATLSSQETSYIVGADGSRRIVRVVWIDPNDADNKINKIASFPEYVPLRHYRATKTVDFQARSDVLSAFRCVNSAPWEGLPRGYWLVSALNGNTYDQGLTYTYSVTWTTQQDRDWSRYEFLLDPTGQPTYVKQSDLDSLVARDYQPLDVHENGVVRVGQYQVADYAGIFGTPSEELENV